MKMMVNHIKHLYTILFCVISLALANAQQEDFSTRWGLGLSGDISKDVFWSAELEQRFYNNSSQKDRSLIQGSLKYELNKVFRLGAGYRTSYIYNLYENNEFTHRFHLEMTARQKIERLKLSYRGKWQYGSDDMFYFQDDEGVLRQRLELEYRPFGWPIEPSVSFEVFTELNSKKQGAFHAHRSALGISYSINKDLSCDIIYLRDVELNTDNPKMNNVIALTLGYDF